MLNGERTRLTPKEKIKSSDLGFKLNVDAFNMKKYEFNPLLKKLRTTFLAGDGGFDYFKNSSGLKLFYRFFLPSNLNKIIIVNHGAGGNGEYHVLLADEVISENVGVYVMDYRGHGNSEGKRGDIEDFRLILSDLHEFVLFIKNKHPAIPIILHGESMGGAVAINYLCLYQSDIKGLLLFSPALKLKVRLNVKDFFIILLSLIVYLFSPGYPFIKMERKDYSGTANPLHEEYDKTDPLHLKKLSPRYILQLNSYIHKAFNSAKFIDIPTLIFQGEKDPAVDSEGIKDFFNRCSSKNKELFIVPNGLHALYTDPNSTKPEINIWNKLRNWLKSFS